MEDRKYILTDETKEVDGHILHRIKAVRDFDNIRAGNLGGWIEQEDNLSHAGFCWVDDEACVYENASVYGDARVLGYALVYGDARIYDYALINGNALVFGNALIYENSWITECAHIYGNSKVYGSAKIFGITEFSNGEIASCGED